MNQQEQVTAIKQALDLTIQISNIKEQLCNLERETFRSKPIPPKQTTIAANYPPIKPNVPFWTTALLPAIVFWPYIIIYYFTTYKKQKEAECERIKNSEEYKAQCRAIDEDRQLRQAEADRQYKAAMKEYNEKILPAYQQEFDKWQNHHNQEITSAQNALSDAKSALDSLYSETKIVPMQYRQIETLEYIYNMVSSSDYTIRESIEMYDKERQRRLEVQKINAQQRANTLADQQIQLTCEQNDLLQEQNYISDRERKNERNAAIIGTIQRHNTNKILKDAFHKKK